MGSTILYFFVAALLVAIGSAREVLHSKTLRHSCDISRGKWISDPSDPPYSESCRFIRDEQNCLENGRPDREYLHWRWKPYGCELPPFDPEKFLNVMTNKVFAFVGDSIVRNQKESLLCLLSKVEEPLLLPDDWNDAWLFQSYNFTVVMKRSQFLLRRRVIKPDVVELHLDDLDPHWTDMYHTYDYAAFGIGPWFDHRTLMLENGTIVGCHGCRTEGVPELGRYYAYRRALNLTFRYVIASDHKPFVIYRIHAPNHFEGGRWNVGGHCNRTLPLKEDDTTINFKEDERDVEYERISREEYAAATDVSRSKKNGVRLEMLDVFHLSLLRPDGHPDRYRGIGMEKKPADCLHWCTPGPVDTWNYLMMEVILKSKNMRSSS